MNKEYLKVMTMLGTTHKNLQLLLDNLGDKLPKELKKLPPEKRADFYLNLSEQFPEILHNSKKSIRILRNG